MTSLNQKYVLHISLYRYVSGDLAAIEINDILDELIRQFHQNGIDSFYISEVKSYYRTRKFDEILITVFSNDDLACRIFEEWFRKNNDVLCQEAFAYEHGNRMIINEL